MPQLNPNPWFPIMILSWLIFSTIIQPKLLPTTPSNHPHNKPFPPIKPTPWTWPWT
uniref:ATP synthase complex subunit 8 n=1 Tax=Phodilus badius TaxID=111818 RepID=W8ELK3_9STRI|nr:ATP synthase subunit 8 [Phodilus badius]AHJ91116.1 ATP synthase subunit 8 [Phodilus badius]